MLTGRAPGGAPRTSGAAPCAPRAAWPEPGTREWGLIATDRFSAPAWSARRFRFQGASAWDPELETSALLERLHPPLPTCDKHPDPASGAFSEAAWDLHVPRPRHGTRPLTGGSDTRQAGSEALRQRGPRTHVSRGSGLIGVGQRGGRSKAAVCNRRASLGHTGRTVLGHT